MNSKSVMQDDNGIEYWIDQAERLNAYGFNKFKDWNCWAGYQSCIIREPGGEVKRAYSCPYDESLGTLDDGFELFKAPTSAVIPLIV